MRRLLTAAATAVLAAAAVAGAAQPAAAHRICDSDIRPCFCDGPVPPLHLEPC